MRGTASKALIAVIIPTYNRAEYLKTAIESVLSQTYEKFRLLVADNTSPDHTPDVVGSFSDSRLEYVRRKENLGWHGNFNAAVATAEEEFLCLLGDDDVMYPDFLESTLGALEAHPGAGMVHGMFDLIGEKGETVRPATTWGIWHREDAVETGQQFIWESMRYGCRVCHSTVLCRSSALPPNAYDPKEGNPADLALWLRIALDSDIAFLARPLTKYRIHGSSLSSQVAMAAGEGYRMSFELVEAVRATKLRFLDVFAHRLSDPAALRRRVTEGTCWDLTNAVRTATSPDRKLLPTLAMLARSTRVEPRLIVDPGAWKVLGPSVLGKRLTDRVRRWRSTGAAG